MSQPTPPPATPPPAPMSPAAPAATPATARKPRSPAWWRKPHVLAAFVLGAALLEVVAFGLAGWAWALAINVAVAVLVWSALLTWRRRGRGGLLDRLFGGRGSHGGGGSRSRTGGRGAGSGGGLRSLIPGAGRRAAARAAGSTGSGAPGSRPGRDGGRFRSLLSRRRTRGADGDRGVGGSGTAGRGATGRRLLRRGARKPAGRTHSTYAPGLAGTNPDGRAKRGSKPIPKAAPGSATGGAPTTTGIIGRLGRWLGVAPPSHTGTKSSTTKPGSGPTPAGGAPTKPQPAPAATGPKPGGSGGQPWNKPQYNPTPGPASTPAPAAVPVPAPRSTPRSTGGTVNNSSKIEGTSLQRFGALLPATETAADTVGHAFTRSEAAAETARAAARAAEQATETATVMAQRAAVAASGDQPRIQAEAREWHDHAAQQSRAAADAAEVAKDRATAAEDAKQQYVNTVTTMANYADTSLPADKRVVAHIETVGRQAAAADTSDAWRGVAANASQAHGLYLSAHGHDQARLDAPRGGSNVERMADHQTAIQDN